MMSPRRPSPLSAASLLHAGPGRQRRFALRPISLAACLLGAAPASFGLPQGAVANGGQASVSLVTPTQMQIHQTTPRAGLDWTSFSIAAGERVTISQPSARSVLVNRVLGNDPSQIHGALNSNGQVWLVNPRGIYFGATSQVDVGGLVATTLALGPQDIASGRLQLGSADADAGELRAEGSITALDGSVLLIAPRLLQSGRVQARRVGLAAASEVLVDVEGDGLIFFNARNDRLDARLSVLGNVLADGGSAELRAAARAGFADTVLNLEGVVRARSLASRNGRIVVDGGSDGITHVAGTLDASAPGSGQTGGDVLVLGQKIMLDNRAVLDASGAGGGGRVRVGGGFQGADPTLRNAQMLVARGGSRIDASASAAGDGGQVVLWADDATRFHGAISARGGVAGGNGGNVEVSGKRWLDFRGTVDTSAPAGYGGTLLLDPLNLRIRDANPDINGVDVLGEDDLVSQTLGFAEHVVSPESIITFDALNTQLNAANANVVLEAQNTITIESAGPTVVAGTGRLTLRAGDGISIGRDISADGGITLSANHPGISAAQTGALTLTGNLAASNGTISISNNGGTGSHALNGNLTADALSLSGDATIAGSRTWTLNSGTSTVNAALGGSGNLTKAGNGTLVLGGSNGYVNTSVTGGVLSVAAAANLGSGGLTLNGGTLQATAGFSLARNLTLGAAGGTIGVGTGNTLTLANPVDGAGALVKTGAGTLALAGARNHVGTTTVNAGTLRIAAGGSNTANIVLGANTLDIADGATVANPVTGVASGATISNSSGSGTLSDSGTLALPDGANLNLASSGSGLLIERLIADANNNASVTVTGSAAVTLANAGNSYGGGTNVRNGGIVAASAAGALGDAGTVTLDNGSLQAGETFNLARPVTLGADGGTFGVAASKTLTLSGDVGGTGSLTKTGAGTLVLSGSNAYGATAINAGVLSVAAAGSLGAGAIGFGGGTLAASETFTLARNVTLNAGGGSFDVAAGKTLTLQNAVAGGAGGSLTKLGDGTLLLNAASSHSAGTTVDAGTLTLAGAGTVGSGAVVLTAATSTLRNERSDTLVLGNLISGSGRLQQAGSGTTQLTDNNTYSGGSTVSNGSLRVSGATAAAGSGTIVLGNHTLDITGGATVSNAVTMDSGATIANSSGAGTLASTGGPLALGAGGSNLNLSSTGTGLLIDRQIQDTGNNGTLTITGSAAVTLSNGSNSYGGETRVGTAGAPDTAGTLKLTHADAASGSAIVLRTGVSVLDIANNITLAKPVTVEASNATITNSQGSGTLDSTGSLALGNGYNLNLSSSAVGLTLARPVTDSNNNATVTVTGSAPVTLSASNTYGGGTSVRNGGSLAAAAAANLGNGGVLSLDNGSLQAGESFEFTRPVTLGAGGGSFDVANSKTLTLSAAVGGAGSLRKLGTGTLVLSGANSYGATAIDAGVLSVAAAGNLGSGAFSFGGGTLAASESLTLSGLTFNVGGASFDVAAGKTLTLQNSSGVGGLAKDGAGTLVLAGTTGYAGTTTVNAGTLGVTGTFNASGSIALGAHTLDISGGAIVASALTVADGATISNSSGTGTLSATGGPLHLGLGVDNLNLTSSGGGLTVARQITDTSDTSTLTVTGSAPVTLSNGANSYGGNTRVGTAGAPDVAGTLKLTHANAASGAAIELRTGVSVLDITNGITLAKPVTVVHNSTITNSQGSGTLDNSGTLALAAAASLRLSSTGSGLVINRQITDAADDGRLAISGSAPVTLGNVFNSHGGGTSVGGGGSLSVSAAGHLGNGGVLTLDDGRLLASAGFTLARPVVLGAGGGSFDVAAANTLGLQDNISGAGSLTKTGAGTLVLAGSNSYGATNVEAGVLSISAAGQLGSGALAFDGGTLTATETLALARNVTLNAGGGSFEVAGGKTLTLANPVGGAGGNLTKTGAGTLVLGATNSYAATAINAGVLSVAAADRLGSGTLSFGGGTLLASDTFTLARSLTLNAGDAVIEVAAGKTLTLPNSVGGAGDLHKVGGGSLVLAGNNSYAATHFEGGSVSVAAAGNLGTAALVFDGGSLAASSSFTLARNITLDAGGGGFDTTAAGTTLTLANPVGGVGSLAKSGSGTLVLATANGYGGGTTINAGTLRVGSTGAAGSGTIALNGHTLDITAGATVGNALTVTSGATITNSQGGGTLDAGGTLLLGAAAHLNLSSAGSGLAVNRQLTDSNNDATVTVTGSAPVTLGHTLNSYGGGSTVRNGGRLAVNAAGSLGDGGVLSFDNGSLLTGASFTLARSLNIAAGGATIDVASGTTLTLPSAVGGSGGLAKTGAGTLVLAGNNSHGTTRIGGGVLSVAAASNLGSGALSLDGGRLLASDSLTLARDVTLGAGGGTFDVAGGKTLTLANPVGGAGALDKQGPGTLVLAGSNSYAGTTTIDDGVLAAAAAANLGLGALALDGGTLRASDSFNLARDVTLNAAGGSFDVAGGRTLTLAHAVGGSGDLTKLGTGTLVLAASNSYGGTHFDAGAVSIGAAGNLGQGALVFDGGSLSASSSFTLNRNVTLAAAGGGFDTAAAGTTLTLSGAVGGAGTLAKSGAGTLVLAGANGYSGGTTVSAGRLRLDATGAAGSGTIALGAHTLDLSGGAVVSNTLTLADGATITNSQGSGTLAGAGTLALADAANLHLASSGSGLTIARPLADGAGSARITVASGSVTLTADNGYDGGSTVASGATLQLGSGGASGDAGSGPIANHGVLKIDRNNSLTLGAAISGSGRLEQAGSGRTELTAANGYSGGTTVVNGTLAVSGAGAGAGSGSIMLATATAVLDIGNGASVANAVTSQGATVANSAGSGELAGSLTLAADSRLSGSGGGLLLSGAVTDGGSGFGIEKTGSGSVTLASAGNSYRGATKVSAGTLRTSGDERIADTSAVVVDAGELAIGGSETIASLAGSGGTVSVPVALRIGAAGTSTAYAGGFSGSGAVEKIGSGTQSLGGSSAGHSGTVSVSAGTLALTAAHSLGSGSSVVVDGGILALAGNHQSVAGVSLRSGSITASGGRLTSASNFDLRDGSVGAALAGASAGVGLDKTTTGSVTLSGSASYGGDTTVSAGSLTLAAAAAVPATTRLIVNGGEFNIGALDVTVGQLQLQSGSVAGSGTLTAGQYLVSGGTSSVGLGAGVLDSSGTTTLSGPVQATQINVNAGVLTLARDDVLTGSGRTVTVAGNATLVNNGNNQAGQLNLAGTLAGSGSFSADGYALDGGNVNARLGGGTLTSTGSSTLNASVGAGTIVVSAGTLAVGSGGQLANSGVSVSVHNGATLQLAGDETVGRLSLAGRLTTASGYASTLTAQNYALAGGSVDTALGSGALTSTGSSSLNAAVAAGTVSVDGGVLALNQAQQLTAAPAVDVAAGATLALGADQTAGRLSGAGAVTLAGYTLATGSGGSSSYAGTLSGSGTLLKQGPSTFTLAGDNQQATTRVAGGTLALAAGGHLADGSTLQVDAGAALQLAADETVGNLALAGSLAAAGGTTPTLTAASYGLNGATVDSALGAGVLTSTGSSALNASVAAASVTVAGGSLTLNRAQQLTARPAVDIAAGATLTLAADQTLGTLAGAGTAALANHVLATGSGGDSRYDGTLTGSGTLLKQGNSTLVLAGDNQQAQTRVAAGTLALAGAQRLAGGSAAQVDNGATLQLAGDQTLASLQLAGTLAGNGTLQATSYRLDGGTVNSALGSGILTSSGGSVLNASVGAGSVLVDSGRLRLAAPQLLSPLAEVTVASGAVLELDGTDTAARLVLRGQLAGSGTLTANRYELDGGSADANLGGGMLVARGNSTLRGTVGAGSVDVLDGRLQLATAQQLQQLPAVTVAAGARIELGADQSFGSLAGSGQLQLGSYTLASGGGGDSSFAGVIDGDGGFIKRGSSVFTLTGANGWRGRTLIEQGTLKVGDNGSSGSLGGGDIENHGTLALARSDNVTLDQAVSGSGQLEQQGSGRLLLGGSNKTYSGATRVLAGELATAGADNLPDSSAVSVAAGARLVLGGRETLQSVAADGSVVLAGDLAAAGELALRGAVTVADNRTVNLSGTRIDAVNPGNRWGAALGFEARDSITLSSGLDGSSQRPLTLAAFSAGAGGRIDAGQTTIAGNGLVGGGRLVISADVAATAGTTDQPPPGKVVQSRAVAYTADGIVQGAASRLEVASGAELSLATPNGASIQLGRLDNQFSGSVSAIAGSPTAPWSINDASGTSLQNRVRIGGSAVNIGGDGVVADIVDINADTVATRGDSTIVARLPFDRDIGTTVSLPALTLTLTDRSFTLTFPYGNVGVEGLHVNVGSRSWGPRTTGPDAGYITVLPRGGGASGSTAVLLVGPNVNAGGYGFFFDGASVQGEVPVYYNGVLPATPQVENSISATVAVSEAARKQRFDEAVRTENVALRLRAGVIAEVGPAPSATQGPEGARLPASCPPATGALSCAAQP